MGMLEIGLTVAGNIAAIATAYSQIIKRLNNLETEYSALNTRINNLAASVDLLLERRKRDRQTGEINE